MAESYGWAGKILRVDLTTGEITTQDDAKYHKYIGGMGMAYRIMYEEAPMDLDPYDEKAQVIFGVGPLTGAGVPCSGRMNVTFRSTWSKGSSIIDAHMGGHIGPMLKYAGWDGIVITGISAKPVYLRIEDDEVSLEDASDIWGKGTFASNKWMVEQNGREFETASIGPAGENLVDYSTLNTSFGNSGGAGLGAAMGNKKLKGLAIRGTGSVKVADPKKVLELSNYMMGNLIGGNNNHNVPAQPQSWAEYSATSGKNRWSGAPGRMWKKAPGGPVDTGEQPYNDINKIALRCFKGYFDFVAPAAEYTVKNGGCSSCPIRCYTEARWTRWRLRPAHPQLQHLYARAVRHRVYRMASTLQVRGRRHHGHQSGMVRRSRCMGLWDNYGNLNRDLLQPDPADAPRGSHQVHQRGRVRLFALGVGEGRRPPLGGRADPPHGLRRGRPVRYRQGHAGHDGKVRPAQELAGPHRRCHQLQPDVQRLPQPPRPRRGMAGWHAVQSGV